MLNRETFNTFGGTPAVLGKFYLLLFIVFIGEFIVNTKPYWFKDLKTETANTVVDTVPNRVFFDSSANSLYWKPGTVTYTDTNVASLLPLPPCNSPADDFTLTAGTLIIDIDVSHLPFPVL